MFEVFDKGKITVELEIVPKLDGKIIRGKFLVKIYNRTEGCHVSDTALNEILKLPKKITFKVNKYKPKHFLFKGEAYHIILTHPQYYGSKFIYIKTNDEKSNILLLRVEIPLTKANVTVTKTQLMDWNRIPEHTKPKPCCRCCHGYTTEVSYDTIRVKVAEVHSVAGVRETFILDEGDALAFEAFSRSISSSVLDCDHLREQLHEQDFASSGKKYAPVYAWPLSISASDGYCYEVKAHVRYRCTYTCEVISGNILDHYVVTETLEPNDVPDLDRGSSISCSVCGSYHPDYAHTITEGESTVRNLAAGDGDNASFSYQVTFYFSFSWGPLTVGISITYWRDNGSYGNPCIKLEILSWESDTLYYWWDNNDPNKWLIHVSWQ